MGMAVSVGVVVETGVDVEVAVGVEDAGTVGVDVGTNVSVGVDVGVAVGTSVSVGVDVGVAVAVGTGVEVNVGVRVSVGGGGGTVSVGVRVAGTVGVEVADTVGVGVVGAYRITLASSNSMPFHQSLAIVRASRKSVRVFPVAVTAFSPVKPRRLYPAVESVAAVQTTSAEKGLVPPFGSTPMRTCPGFSGVVVTGVKTYALHSYRRPADTGTSW